MDDPVLQRWQAQFRAANLEQHHVDSIIDWHYRLGREAEQHQQEQRILGPQQRAAMEQQRKALTAKRFAGGLSQREEATLRGIYEKLAQEGQK